jgi:hypothetical protein
MRENTVRKDYQLMPDQVQPDYCCHAQQGDVHTSCGRVARITRYVNAWGFVSCPDCLRMRATRQVRRDGLTR